MARENNITRMLRTKNIAFEAFETINEKLGALETAQFLRIEPDQVFKSIVVTRESRGKHLLVVIPGTGKVDLKKVAAMVGEKKLLLPTEKEAEALTGLLAGGISPLALLNKGFEFYLDETAFVFERIHISGGERGLNIALAPDDLVSLINPKIGDYLAKQSQN